MGNRHSSYKVQSLKRQTPSVVSDYRKKKFESYFNFLDANKDGCISKGDYELAANNMALLSNANPAEAADLLATLMAWWKVQSAENGDDAEIPISEVVERVEKYCVTTDPIFVEKQTRSTYENTFDLIDRNKDGVISSKELVNYYKSYGVHDEHFIQDVFKVIDVTGNGVISRDDFIDAHVAFWLSDDPKSGFHFLYDVPEGLLL